MCGDININLADSLAIVAATDSGLLIDIGHERATEVEEDEGGHQRKVPQKPTIETARRKGTKARGRLA